MPLNFSLCQKDGERIHEFYQKESQIRQSLDDVLNNPHIGKAGSIIHLLDDNADLFQIPSHYAKKQFKESILPHIQEDCQKIESIERQVHDAGIRLIDSAYANFCELESALLDHVRTGNLPQAKDARKTMDDLADRTHLLLSRHEFATPNAEKLRTYLHNQKKREATLINYERALSTYLSTDFSHRKKGLNKISRKFTWWGGNLIKKLEKAGLSEYAYEARQLKDEISYFKKNFDIVIAGKNAAYAYLRQLHDQQELIEKSKVEELSIRTIEHVEELLEKEISPIPLRYTKHLTQTILEAKTKLRTAYVEKKGALRTSSQTTVEEVKLLLKRGPTTYDGISHYLQELNDAEHTLSLYESLGFPTSDLKIGMSDRRKRYTSLAREGEMLLGKIDEVKRQGSFYETLKGRILTDPTPTTISQIGQTIKKDISASDPLLKTISSLLVKEIDDAETRRKEAIESAQFVLDERKKAYLSGGKIPANELTRAYHSLGSFIDTSFDLKDIVKKELEKKERKKTGPKIDYQPQAAIFSLDDYLEKQSFIGPARQIARICLGACGHDYWKDKVNALTAYVQAIPDPLSPQEQDDLAKVYTGLELSANSGYLGRAMLTDRNIYIKGEALLQAIWDRLSPQETLA